MKKFKFTRGITIILITLLLIIIGVILVATIANDEVRAAEACTCADGPEGPYSYSYYNTGTGTHRVNVSCGTCGGIFSYYDDTCESLGWQPSANVSNTHAKYCTKCHYAIATGTCYDNGGDGTCDVCGNTISSGSGSGSGSGGSSDSYTYDWYSSTQHYYWGSTGAKQLENHSSSSWTDQGNGTHWAFCDKCGGAATFSHSGATHSNGGTCTSCGAVYDEHGQSTTATSYETSSTGHTPTYACVNSSCSITYTGTEEAHSGGNSTNGGTCTTCGYQYLTHMASTTVKEYKTSSTGHTPVYACVVSGCTETFDGTEVAHSGATHANEGTCTTCSYQYETHGKSSTVSSYSKTSTGHTPIYACTNSSCSETYTGTEVAHSGGTHDNEGICTTCSYQYQTHSKSSTISSYSKTSTSHTPLYKCTCSGCTTTYTGTASSHSGATHSNGGKCTTCSYIYQTHSKSSTITSYTKSETTHTPIYKCSHEGCTETYEGNAENHNYQNGVCACGQEEPQEEITEIEITSEKYELDDTYITKVQPGTTIEQFKSDLETNAIEINIYNNDELVTEEIKIGTGMTIELKNGEQTKTFTIIVRGDSNGDGEADFKDIVKINQARLNRTTLEEIYALAADVTDDGEVDFKDLVKINRYRLNKIESNVL